MNCIDCGGIFVPGDGSGRPRVRCYACSPAARKKGPRKAHRPPVYGSSKPSRCSQCGAPFTAHLPHEKFCGSACRTRDGNVRRQMARRDRSPRPCSWCGSVFAPAYGDRRTAFCSAECVRARHAKRTSGKAHIRRAIRHGATIERVDKVKVFARDGWRCRLCGVETPREAMGSMAPIAPELDHIVPLSRGGGHTYDNTQCACARCNRAKRDLSVEEFLGLLAA